MFASADNKKNFNFLLDLDPTDHRLRNRLLAALFLFVLIVGLLVFVAATHGAGIVAAPKAATLGSFLLKCANGTAFLFKNTIFEAVASSLFGAAAITLSIQAFRNSKNYYAVKMKQAIKRVWYNILYKVGLGNKVPGIENDLKLTTETYVATTKQPTPAKNNTPSHQPYESDVSIKQQKAEPSNIQAGTEKDLKPANEAGVETTKSSAPVESNSHIMPYTTPSQSKEGYVYITQQIDEQNVCEKQWRCHAHNQLRAGESTSANSIEPSLEALKLRAAIYDWNGYYSATLAPHTANNKPRPTSERIDRSGVQDLRQKIESNRRWSSKR